MPRESIGRTIGPAGFAVTYASSISSAAWNWVDYHFLFYVSAAVLGMAAVLGWQNYSYCSNSVSRTPGAGR